MAARTQLLYIAPVWPDTRGNGLAMRAGMVLEALSAHCDVSLLVVEIYGGRSATAERLVARCCRASAAVRPQAARRGRLARLRDQPPEIARLSAPELEREPPFAGVQFDVVHVFRLYAAPFAEPFLRARPRPRLHLDLDDVESQTRSRLAGLYRLNGDEASARHEAGEARAFASWEKQLLPGFDRVYVCSESDRRALTERYRCRSVGVAPNAVRLPESAPPGPEAPAPGAPFTFLFVGTLGYYPNADAVGYFCREVLPLLKEMAPGPFRLQVVGAGAGRELERLAALPEVSVIGAVPEVANYYRAANAAVVPVRAGGGTRIKVLEAFASARPVVATTIGIEGIEAVAGEHVLLGDSPGAFAAACAKLMRDEQLAARLAANAFELARERYSLPALVNGLGDS